MRAPDHSEQIRAELLRFFGRSLEPLFPGEGVAAILPDWLAELPTHALAAALCDTPADTAIALAGALTLDPATLSTDERIEDLARREYGHRADLEQLVRYAQILRRLTIDHNGQVTFAHLFAEGFTSVDQFRLTRPAAHVLYLLAGDVPTKVEGRAPSPAERLRAAGTRALARRTPSAA